MVLSWLISVQGLNYDMYWHFVRLYYVIETHRACLFVEPFQQEDNFYSNAENEFGEDTVT